MVHEMDPLTDARWSALIRSHRDASVFHSVPWLSALRQTYGYEPVVLTTSPPGEALRNGVVFCRIRSWLTGHRWVSLPFSDHAEPLLEQPSELPELLAATEARLTLERLRYVEFRPLSRFSADVFPGYAGSTFAFHQLDLLPSLDTLFQNLHPASIQRKIRRAEREKLVYAEGQSSGLLDSFYGLMMLTRKRHALPPQPMQWFRNLIVQFGADLKIRVASRQDRPIAAILTLRSGNAMVYKYGCSNEAEHNLGGMQMLMWNTIREAKQEGLTVLDLGRSDCSNTGLITYKDRWGTERSTLTYFRRTRNLPGQESAGTDVRDWKLHLAGLIFSRLPVRMSSWAGGLLYKHVG